MKIRLKITYSGQVQGVGFRYRVSQISKNLAVTGFVQNQSDGSVLLVAEGEKEILSDFHRMILSQMESNIANTDLDWLDATGEYGGFSIRG